MIIMKLEKAVVEKEVNWKMGTNDLKKVLEIIVSIGAKNPLNLKWNEPGQYSGNRL